MLPLAMGKEVLSPCSFRFTFVTVSLKFTFNILALEDEDLGPGGKKIHAGIAPAIIANLTEHNAAVSVFALIFGSFVG